MEINGTIKGDLSLFRLNYNKEAGHLFAILRVDTRVHADKSQKLFGEAFTAAAFGGMRERSNGENGHYEFPYNSMKPKLVGERHSVTIGDVEAVILPKVFALKPYKSEADVIATIELPIYIPAEKTTGNVSVSGKKMLGELAAMFGKVVSVKLNSKQMPLELPEGTLATKAGKNWGRAEPAAPIE